MGGPIIVTPKKEERKIITKVEFKVGEKTYIAKFGNPPKIGEVAFPEGKSKTKIDEGFMKMMKEEYKAKIYVVDKEGNETLVKNPSPSLYVNAGKTLMIKSMVYSSILEGEILGVTPKKK